MTKFSLVFAFLLCGLLAAAQQTAPVEVASAKPSAGTLTVTDIPATNNQLSLPAGSAIRIRLSNSLSTLNRRGDRFSGTVTEAVSSQGKLVIPVSSTVQGEVLSASSPRRIKGRPRMTLLPQMVTLPDGKSYWISATVVDTGDPKAYDVNNEGQIRGPGHSRSDLVIGGIGTGFGATIGAVAGGPAGALIGAGVGATASTVRWLANQNEMMLPAGTELILELNRPMDSAPHPDNN